jgi:uncharacterized membrane protein
MAPPASSSTSHRGEITGQPAPASELNAPTEELRSKRPPVAFATLFVLTAAWAVAMGVLIVRQHNHFATLAFDLGIYDQATWLTAHGQQFSTVRGLAVFGHHASFGLLLFAPLYWFGADGPTVLNLAQVAALAAVPLVVYWLARRVGLGVWVSAALGAATLAHFSMSWLVQEGFHPEVFAVAPLLAAVGFAWRSQHRAYWAMLAVAVIWKEDVALAVAGLGAFWMVGRRWRLGTATAAAGLVWFVCATQLLIPAFSPTGEAFYVEGFYGDLGTSVTEIAATAVSDPGQVRTHLANADAAGYLSDLHRPFGYVSLFAPSTLLVGLPQLAANLLSVHSSTWKLEYHYVAVPFAAACLGLVFGVRRLRQPGLQAAAAAAVLVCALLSGYDAGIAPFARQFAQGAWALERPGDLDAKREAVSLIPDGASVSASYHFVPHLSSRPAIYMFPNPFIEQYWGVDGSATHDPSAVEFIIVAENNIDDDARVLLGELRDSGEFEAVSNRDGVMVLVRCTVGRACERTAATTDTAGTADR